MAQLLLADVIEQIKSEIDVDSQGKSKASVRATARLAGVSDTALRKALSSANLEPLELAKRLILQGFDAANLSQWLTHGIPDMAIATILEYYAFDAGRYCNEQARLAYKAFAATGVRIWIQQIKGWQQPSISVKEEVSTLEPSVKEISEAIACVFCFNNVEPNLIQGVIANQIGKAYPQLKTCETTTCNSN